MCVMCGTFQGSVNHPFYTCKVALKVWYLTDAWVGRLFVHCDKAEKHFEQIGVVGLNSMGNSMWITIIWGIWNLRNSIIFNNAEVGPVKIFTVPKWVSYKFLNTNFSYSDWCINLYACLNLVHWWFAFSLTLYIYIYIYAYFMNVIF